MTRDEAIDIAFGRYADHYRDLCREQDRLREEDEMSRIGSKILAWAIVVMAALFVGSVAIFSCAAILAAWPAP